MKIATRVRMYKRPGRLTTEAWRRSAAWLSAILLMATSAFALETYDLKADFGDGADTNNPNRQWSLRYGSELLPQHYWLGSESAWLWDWSGSTVPSFAFETQTKWNDCQPGDIVMQGAFGGASRANILWTAPGNGTINIAGRTWDAYGGRGGSWTLSITGTQVAGGTIAASSKRNSVGVTFFENLAAGQSITNVPVATGTQVVFNQDSGTAGIEMTISYAANADTNIIIRAFSGNGMLSWTAGSSVASATIEWAPTASGPWTNTWVGLVDIPNTGATCTVAVPMFYRVIGKPAP